MSYKEIPDSAIATVAQYINTRSNKNGSSPFRVGEFRVVRSVEAYTLKP
jgi:hypothetical protein